MKHGTRKLIMTQDKTSNEDPAQWKTEHLFCQEKKENKKNMDYGNFIKRCRF
jgi:hypothetical protein